MAKCQLEVFHEEKVTLTLTYEEAVLVKCLVGGVTGGGPVRDVVSSVFAALHDGGVPHLRYLRDYFVGSLATRSDPEPLPRSAHDL